MIQNKQLPDTQALYQAARSRTDAAASVDAAHTLFLSRLGVLNSLQSDGTKAPAAAAAERTHLVESHRTMLRGIAEAGEAQLRGILFPHAPTMEQNRAARAAELVAEARNQGLILSSPAAGIVEAYPKEKLSGLMRGLIGDLREELSAFIRSRVETFAPA